MIGSGCIKTSGREKGLGLRIVKFCCSGDCTVVVKPSDDENIPILKQGCRVGVAWRIQTADFVEHRLYRVIYLGRREIRLAASYAPRIPASDQNCAILKLRCRMHATGIIWLGTRDA